MNSLEAKTSETLMCIYAPDPWKRIFYKLETVYPSSSCITPHLNVRTMSRVARIAAYTIVSPLRASDRSYRSPRALARSFKPLWHVQRLDLPSSTSTHYREKHRSTISLHQMGCTTFKLVRSAHRRSSDTSHSSEQQKQRSKRFEACLRQCVEVEDRSALRRHICTPSMPQNASISSTYTIWPLYKSFRSIWAAYHLPGLAALSDLPDLPRLGQAPPFMTRLGCFHFDHTTSSLLSWVYPS